MVNIQPEQNICTYRGALQSVVWGELGGLDQQRDFSHKCCNYVAPHLCGFQHKAT